MTDTDKKILRNLPVDTSRVVLSNPKKRDQISKVVGNIYKTYREDFRALSKS